MQWVRSGTSAVPQHEVLHPLTCVSMQENAAAFFVKLTIEDRTFLEEAFHTEKVCLTSTDCALASCLALFRPVMHLQCSSA